MVTDALASYLGALFGSARPSTLVEVRWRTAGGMRRRFARVDALERVASVIRSLGVGNLRGGAAALSAGRRACRCRW